MEEDGNVARDQLAQWTEKTRALKIERTSEEAVDLRGIDMGKADFSKVKQVETKHVRD